MLLPSSRCLLALPACYLPAPHPHPAYFVQLQQEAASLGILEVHSPELELLPAAIGQLHSLLILSLGACSQLRRLPGCLGHLNSLQILELPNCSQLKQLPASLGYIGSLQTLDLSGCSSLEHLPASLCQLSGLQTLNLRNCSRLRRLPDPLGQLSSLQWLDLSGCSELQQLPVTIGQLSQLYSLELGACSQLEELPNSIGQLRGLLNLIVSDCKQLQHLPHNIGQLTGLQRLYLSGCSQLQELPSSLGQLSSLQTLDLAECGQLRELPVSLGQLTGLQALNVSACGQLERLPDLSACSQLELSMSGVRADGSSVKMRPIRVPVDHLPPRLQSEHPSFVFDQTDALQRTMTSISWIAVLLAVASFMGFVTIPGGFLDLGNIKIQLRRPKLDATALRIYCMANICTFFLSLGTALFCMAENMPHAVPRTAGRIILSVVIATCLLFVSIGAAGCTFLSGIYAVYPKRYYDDLMPPAIAAGTVLAIVFLWCSRNVWRLFFRWRRAKAKAPIPNLLVTPPDHSGIAVLKSILVEMSRNNG